MISLFLLYGSLMVIPSAKGQPFGGFIAIAGVDFKGNTIVVDSFDSSDPAKSFWQTNLFYRDRNYGTYTNTQRTANATVVTTGGIINVGNAEIYGYVNTGPGGIANLNSGGSVGDLAWVGSGTPGIQPGHARDDMNLSFPDAALPPVTWTPLPILPIGGTNIGGTIYYYVITNNLALRVNGVLYYKIASQLQKSLICLTTNAVLYLASGLKYGTSPNALTISTNCDLTIYTADDIIMGSGVINNINKYAPALKLYGLPTIPSLYVGCTSITFGAFATWIGYLYAPSASLSFNGGGATASEMAGSLICHDLQVFGHYNFHFDEALASYEPLSIYAQPNRQAALAGSDVTLIAAIYGGSPLTYGWLFNQTSLPASYDNQSGIVSLSLTNVQLSDAGNYSFVVSNLFNTVTSSPALLFVYTNINQLIPQMSSDTGITNGQFHLSLAGVAGLNYTIQSSTNLLDWIRTITKTSPFNFLDTNVNQYPQRFYRSFYSY